MELNKSIKQLRVFNGLTQTELCDKFNQHPYAKRKLNKVIMSRMERGDYNISAMDMMAFADVFCLALDTLRDVMENKIDSFDAAKKTKAMDITTSYMVADGGYQGGIFSFPIGAKVLVNIQRKPENGDLVAIRTDDMDEGSAAIRRYTPSLGQVLLIAEDKNYPAMPLNQQIILLGVVQDVILRDVL